MAKREALAIVRAPIAREKIRKPRANIYFAGTAALDFIPSGCKLLDLALGGGWAERRIINIVGDRSTGKTLLCIEAAANFARTYAVADIYYRESEHAFDESYAKALGMPMNRVDYDHKLATVEDMFEDLEAVIHKRRRPALYIVDSLDALGDRNEMSQAIDKNSYGAAKAKVLSQTFRRLTGQLSASNVTLMIVSQVRDKIGAFGFGKKWTRNGGRALDFYASQIVYLAHLGIISRTLGKQKRPVGVAIKALLDKNKVGLPFRSAEFEIMFGYGIDDAKACIKWLTQTDPKYFGKRKPADVLAGIRNGNAVELADIHEYVASKWYSIEQSFLPTRGKYE